MSKSQRAFFAMIALLILSAGSAVGVFYMMRSQLEDKSQEVHDLKVEKEVISEQIKIFEDAKAKVEELSYVEDIAEAVLPSTKDQAEGVAELRKFADTAGMTIQSISFGGGVSEDASDLEISQTIAVSGLAGVRLLPTTVAFAPGSSYNDILEFLEQIESNRRKMQIANVTISPNDANPTEIRMR